MEFIGNFVWTGHEFVNINNAKTIYVSRLNEICFAFNSGSASTKAFDTYDIAEKEMCDLLKEISKQ